MSIWPDNFRFKSWRTLRIALCIMGFATGLFEYSEFGLIVAEFNILTLVIFLGFTFFVFTIFIPASLLVVVGFQAKLHPHKKWTYPTWDSPVLDFCDPLLFFHAAAYAILATGTGFIVSAIFRGLPALIDGILIVYACCLTLFTIKLCAKKFKHKYTTTTAETEAIDGKAPSE